MACADYVIIDFFRPPEQITYVALNIKKHP